MAVRLVCWYDWNTQMASLKKLVDYDFQWVLPAHGEEYHTHNTTQMKNHVQQCVKDMSAEVLPANIEETWAAQYGKPSLGFQWAVLVALLGIVWVIIYTFLFQKWNVT